MEINEHSQIKAGSVPIQYTVYAYDKYCGDVIGYNKWRCLLNSDNKQNALAEAERLFETERFEKIEVKQKVFNSKQKRHLVSTCQVLDMRSKQNSLMAGALFMLVFSSLILLILEVL